MVTVLYVALKLYKYIIIFNMLINNLYYKKFISCYITYRDGKFSVMSHVI